MFLNIGSDIEILVKDVVSIVNIDKKNSKNSRNKKKSTAAKTMVVTANGTYLSKMSSKTLKRRLTEIINLINYTDN